MFNIEKFVKEDFDELLCFYDTNFGRTGERSFLNFLPPMWYNNDSVIGRNFGIKKDGKIIAAMGVYPHDVNICGEKIRVATTGNVAVSPNYRNMGLMGQMMNFAFEELNKQNIDAARLSGDRIRYNRYGYEFIGQSVNYILTLKNVNSLSSFEEYKFELVRIDDEDSLFFIKKQLNSKPFFVDRGNAQNVFKVMNEFYGSLYLAYDKQGNPIGSISVSEDRKQILDFCAESSKIEIEMIYSFVKSFKTEYVRFSSPIWNSDFNRIAGSICESTVIDYATQCKILNWEKLINASLKLKNMSCNNSNKGTIVIELIGYGRMEIDGVCCKKTEKRPDLVLDALAAQRLIFGILPSKSTAIIPSDKEVLFNSIFPLPFWWNCLDKV